MKMEKGSVMNMGVMKMLTVLLRMESEVVSVSKDSKATDKRVLEVSTWV